ncbi:sugar ABC transporter substrate-binding protein [Mycobacterium sp. CVI_P3]|uniref:Sugar ABC transporter substrate-binding protein n=1 Tax=Mycobacterium pinniadriaticum TaxID=2994102 RepID=A0ABT3SCZ6_9MYCO|nr:sugar ABC transporter substrate-binding protein [Mycobacterium pinniadriaticum]MCX2930949.1 sugar ABC transporter substrate-binding protein [Mycobacterium pinniadriaticum]MCX2937373.1 sugar ABC transporter substrate-binding protein [Mycobacterium pinniadriaticum]
MSWPPRSSSRMLAGLVAVALLLVAGVLVLGRAGESSGRIVITVRLWDPAVAAAYTASFAEFTRTHPDIDVRTNVVPYASYFTTLRTDVAGGGADDIFWINNASLAEYADSHRLLAIEPSPDWDPSVIEQFTRNGALWGVPQLTDAGIALYYNADLLAGDGVEPAELDTLRWDPDPGIDTLRPMLTRLTHGRQWGYNAANDLQAIYINYIGSAGGVFTDGDRFAFDNPPAVTAFAYIVGLINTDHVAPPASDTNDNGDFSRNQFLSGRMALFQSGTYNLAQVAEQAPFRWGVALLPAGPSGRVSVTNGIVAAGNPASRHPAAVREVLTWLGSTRGNSYVGRHGAAIPAVLPAQQVYFDYWSAKGVDVTPFFTVLDGPRIAAPGGAGFAAGYQAIQPYFDEMFLGRMPVTEALATAQSAANTAATR